MRNFAAFVLLIAVLVAASTREFYRQAQSEALVAALADIGFAQRERTLQLIDAEASVRGYAATLDRRFLGSYALAQTGLKVDEARLQNVRSGDPAVDALMASLNPRARQIARNFAAEIASAGIEPRAATNRRIVAGKTLIDAYREGDALVRNLVHQKIAATRLASVRAMQWAATLPCLAGLLLLLGAGVWRVRLRDRSLFRRAAQRAEHLEEVNRLMAMAEQMADVGYWRFDLQASEIYWSASVYRMYGQPETFRPTVETAMAAFVLEDRARNAALIERAVSEGIPFRCESRIVRPDGTQRNVIASGQPDRGPDGSITGLIGIFADITERNALEDERDQLLTRVTLATQAGRIGIWDWDISANEIVWDQNMYALRGVDAATVRDAGMLLLFEGLHPADSDRIRSEVARSVADDARYDTEFRIIWPNGEVRHMHSQATVVRDAAYNPLRMVGMNWDITEVRQLGEQLKKEKEQLLDANRATAEANRVKTDFLTSMSHEIRTPMNGIIGLTSLLLDANPRADQRRDLGLLADAARSLLAIINDILDLSKVEAGKIDLEAIALSPAGLVEGAVSIVRGEALVKGIALEIEIEDGVPSSVHGDPTRLRQILLNLLTNALKFTERGTVSVAVRTEREGGCEMLRFEVSDTGIGIATDRQHLLFENFSQLDRSDTRRYGGTGVGLAIAKRLAEAMGGTVGLRSVPGEGSVFWFTALLPETAAALEGPISNRKIFDTTRRILVVDDNPINQLVAKGLLTKDGHDVVLMADGAAAVAAVQASTFDLILMDMQMPVMDGLEATRRIRAMDGPVRNIPIVALSANAMTDQIARCREAGMNDHLAKPIDRKLLRQAIAIWTTSGAWCSDASVAGPLSTPIEREIAPSKEAVELENELLLALFNGDVSAVAALLDIAIATIRVDVQHIERGIEANDAKHVREAAERLNGTSGSLRALHVGKISAAIECAFRTDSATVAAPLLVELQAAVDILSHEIEAYVERATFDAVV